MGDRVPWFVGPRCWARYVASVFYESFRHPLSTSYVQRPRAEDSQESS
jgi:hypothetical protein